MTAAEFESLPSAALAYRALGFSVIPAESRGKRPLITWTKHQRERADPDQIAEWWVRWPDANIALVTGRVSGIVVLDADGAEGLTSLKALGTPATTPLARTGRGVHQFFQCPDIRVPSRVGLRAHLDVRAEGGCVVVPPSVHPSGRVYSWVTPPWQVAPAPLPKDVLQLLAAPLERSRVCCWMGPALGPIPEGERNNTLYRLARSLCLKGLSTDAILAALLAENRQRCQPPLPELELRDLVKHVLTQRHRAEFRADPMDARNGPILERLADVVPEEIGWVWPGRLAHGKLTLVIGDPGVGKSFLALDIAARLSRGRAWPDGASALLGDVVLLSAEDGVADTIRPRVDALGGDAARIHVLRGVRDDDGERPFSLARDLEALGNAVARTGACLVILDPASAYLGDKDSYKDSEIRSVLAPLATLAERVRVAVVAVMHLTKDTQRRAIHRPLGSVAFVAAARVVLAVAKDPEDEDRRVLVGVKNNLTFPPQALAFTVQRGGLEWSAAPVAEADADRLLAGPPNAEERTARRDAEAFLLELLHEGPVLAAEAERAAKAQGIALRTLDRARRTLGVRAYPVGFSPKRWYITLDPKNATSVSKGATADGVASFEQAPAEKDEFSRTSPKDASAGHVAPYDGALWQRGEVAECFSCRQRRWWRSRAGVVICRICHPPADPDLVAALVGENENCAP